MQLSHFDDEPLKSLKQGRRNQFTTCHGFAWQKSWVYDSLDSPIENVHEARKDGRFLTTKPIGLWLSDENSKDGFGWKDLSIEQNFAIGGKTHETLIEADMSRTLHLSTIDDVIQFVNEYGYHPHSKDSDKQILWNELSRDYAGILITPWIKDYYFEHLALKSNDYSFYALWDCSSGCWWDASALEIIGHKLAFDSKDDALERIKNRAIEWFDGCSPSTSINEDNIKFYSEFSKASLHLFDVKEKDIKDMINAFQSGIESSFRKKIKKDKSQENIKNYSKIAKSLAKIYTQALQSSFEEEMEYEKRLDSESDSATLDM